MNAKPRRKSPEWVWTPYSEPEKLAGRGRAPEGRDLEFTDALAIMASITYYAAQARLSAREMYVLNAVVQETLRWQRVGWWSGTHTYLAEFTGMDPKRHGEHLKTLAAKGFIVYEPGTSKGDGAGHRQTNSRIRVRIPSTWAMWKDGSWRRDIADDGPEPDDDISFADLDIRFSVASGVAGEVPYSLDPVLGGPSAAETRSSVEAVPDDERARGNPAAPAANLVALDRAVQAVAVDERQVVTDPVDDVFSALTANVVLGPTPVMPPDEITECLMEIISTAEARESFERSGRRKEIEDGIRQLRHSHPKTSNAEVGYIVGRWAAERNLQNANFFHDFATRRVNDASAMVDQLVNHPPRGWVEVGITDAIEWKRSRAQER